MSKKENLVKMAIYNENMSHFENEIENFCAYHKIFTNKMKIPIHWHDNYLEFDLIIGGDVHGIYNGNPYHFQKGQFTIYSYNDYHSLNTNVNSELYKANVSYDLLNDEIKSYLYENNNIQCLLTGKDYEYMLSLFEKLVYYFENKENNGLNLMAGKALISTMISEAFTHANLSGSMNTKPNRIQNIVQYINKNISNELTLEHVANHFGSSANYLGKQFKRHMGMPYNEYLNKIRLKVACKMISSSNVTMKEISHNCGFSSLEYFYYVFKKYYNMTPLQYRERK